MDFSAAVSGQEEDQDEAGRDPGSQREDNAQPCLHRKSAIITTRLRIFLLAIIDLFLT